MWGLDGARPGRRANSDLRKENEMTAPRPGGARNRRLINQTVKRMVWALSEVQDNWVWGLGQERTCRRGHVRLLLAIAVPFTGGRYHALRESSASSAAALTSGISSRGRVVPRWVHGATLVEFASFRFRCWCRSVLHPARPAIRTPRRLHRRRACTDKPGVHAGPARYHGHGPQRT